MLGPDAWLLASWIVVGAAWLLLHAVVVWQAVREGSLAAWWRLLALVPPAAPVVAWKAGRRVAPVLWAVFLALYASLRLLE